MAGVAGGRGTTLTESAARSLAGGPSVRWQRAGIREDCLTGREFMLVSAEPGTPGLPPRPVGFPRTSGDLQWSVQLLPNAAFAWRPGSQSGHSGSRGVC